MSTTRKIHDRLGVESEIHSKLTTAAASNNMAAVKQLFPISNMAWQEPVYGNTALHWAVANSNVNIAIYLAEHAKISDINRQDLMKKTALHLAIGKGWDHSNSTRKNEPTLDNIILTLIEKTQLDTQDIYGNTPLHIAVMRRDAQCVQSLLKNGARFDIQNRDHQTPLDMLKMSFSDVNNFIDRYAHCYTLVQKTWEENLTIIRKLIKDYSIIKSCPTELKESTAKTKETPYQLGKG